MINWEEEFVMFKMKIYRGVVKRLKKIGIGKLKRVKVFKKYILIKKFVKIKMNLRKLILVSDGDVKRIV